MLPSPGTHWLFCAALLTLVTHSHCDYTMHTDRGVIVVKRDTRDIGASRRVKRETVTRDTSGFNKKQKMELLMSHNDYRSGRKAADMLMMEWNDDLGDLAQEYAEQCNFQHSQSSYRKNVGGFAAVGENLYAGTADFEPRHVVKSWYDEINFFNYQTLGCTPGEQCGHYTQVVWASSYALGCGVKYCDPLLGVSFGKGYHVVCHYGPAGNYRGQKPYALGQGKVCTNCPKEFKFCVKNMCSFRPQIGSGASRNQGTGSHSVVLLVLLLILHGAAAFWC